MRRNTLRSAGKLAAMACLMMSATAIEAKKKPKEPPPPPPPPPPVMIYVAPKPLVPNNASPVMAIPGLAADGLRVTPNRNISPAQSLWNLRSAYNVAALNCFDPKHASILPSYKLFLRANAKTLALANRTVDAEWRKKYGAGFIRPREKYMTEVYNHFAIPPITPAFCDAMVVVGNDAKLIKPAKLPSFALTALPSVEIVFDDFFRRYDLYRAEMAEWQAKWGSAAVPGTLVPLLSLPILPPPPVVALPLPTTGAAVPSVNAGTSAPISTVPALPPAPGVVVPAQTVPAPVLPGR